MIAGVGHGAVLRPDGEPRPVGRPPEEEGKASGVNNTIREIGGVFGVAVLATVFSADGGYTSPQSFVDGMVAAVWVGAGVVAFAVVAALFVPSKRRLEELHAAELGGRLVPAPVGVPLED